MIHLPIFFRVASLALGQSYDCPSASEVTLKDMDKRKRCASHQSTNVYIIIGMYCIYWCVRIWIFIIYPHYCIIKYWTNLLFYVLSSDNTYCGFQYKQLNEVWSHNKDHEIYNVEKVWLNNCTSIFIHFRQDSVDLAVFLCLFGCFHWPRSSDDIVRRAGILQAHQI